MFCVTNCCRTYRWGETEDFATTLEEGTISDPSNEGMLMLVQALTKAEEREASSGVIIS